MREFFRKTAGPAPPALSPVASGGQPVTCGADVFRPGADLVPSPRLDPMLFTGLWKNTDSATRGMREVRMSDRDGGLLLEFEFADDQTGAEGAETVGDLYAEQIAGTVATQFHAVLEGSRQTLRMHGWVKLGVLVIAVFRHPTDPGGPAPWFDREFFYQADRP